MKHLLVLLCPVIAGLAIVIQNGVNSQLVQGPLKLGSVLLLNCVISVAAVLLLSTLIPHFFGINWEQIRSPRALILIPGLSGLLIIALLPFSFQGLGASKTLAILIAVQLLGAALWDLWIRHEALSISRWIGIGVTLTGAWITVQSASPQ